MVESCVLPTLPYCAKNWSLDTTSLDLLERFQAEMGHRILRLLRRHSTLSVLIGLSWPSMKARVLNLKPSFLCRLLSADPSQNNIATSTFRTLASKEVYEIGLVQQCLFLDSCLGTAATAAILNQADSAMSALSGAKNAILVKDRSLIHQEESHQSTLLASHVNLLRVWEAARDLGPYWTTVTQSFYRLLTTPIFGNRICWKCSNQTLPSLCFVEHLAIVSAHCTNSIGLDGLLSTPDSESDLSHSLSNPFHCIKVCCRILVYKLCMCM